MQLSLLATVVSRPAQLQGFRRVMATFQVLLHVIQGNKTNSFNRRRNLHMKDQRMNEPAVQTSGQQSQSLCSVYCRKSSETLLGRWRFDDRGWFKGTTRFAAVWLIIGVILGCTETPVVLDEFVRCRTLDGDRTAIPILKWEFDVIARTLEDCPPDRFLSLDHVSSFAVDHMPDSVFASLQQPKESIRMVLLELEVRGLFERETPRVGGDEIRLRRAEQNGRTN